jgi:STE24 endopeptidase
MSNRSWLLLCIGFLSVVLAVLIGISAPWRVLPIAIHPLPASSDFSAADISRAEAFHDCLIPWGIGSWALGFVLAGIAGFTSVGSRLVGLLPGPFFLRAFLGVIVIQVAINLAELPLDASREKLFRTYGLSTQDWRSWLIDRLQHFAIGSSLTAVGLALLVVSARIFGQRWWIAGGAGAALLVIVASFAYPLIEPVFNKFTPMTSSPLRDNLMAMASRDGVPVKQILIADASRRTTALNAYVSGFGASRRIVLYDVLLTSTPPAEVELVVAHELGHAKSNDVGRFTLVGALSSAIAVMLIALLLRWAPLLYRAGLTPTSNPLADPRSVALVLALIASMTLLAQPVTSLLSRNIEARADVHALNLTRDPQTFVAMQRTLSISNLSDPKPATLIFWLFSNHPTPPQRIAIARAFARLQHEVVPPALSNR